MTHCDVPWITLTSVPWSCHVSEWLWCWTDTPVVALRLESQKTVSHRIGSAAVRDPSCCYKLIVFDLFDTFDCQETYNASPPPRLPNISSIQDWRMILYVYVFASEFKLWGLSACQGCVSFLWFCRLCRGRTVCWHVCVFVQPRFSSSTEYIYRTTPSNPNHSKVACTDTQAICFPIMFLCDSVERALKQHAKGEQYVFVLILVLIWKLIRHVKSV